MASLIWKIIFVLLTPLVIIGFIRMSLGASPDEFLPPYSTLLQQFASMPDFVADVRTAIDTFNNAMASMQVAFGTIEDLPSFFSAFASFFSMVGNALLVAFQCVAIPFKFLYWFFAVIFAISPSGQSSAPAVLNVLY